jgi:hypothetical protein
MYNLFILLFYLFKYSIFIKIHNVIFGYGTVLLRSLLQIKVGKKCHGPRENHKNSSHDDWLQYHVLGPLTGTIP